MAGVIVHEDNLAFLKGLNAGIVALIYIDPPFNTGKRQTRRRDSEVTSGYGYDDSRADYIGWMRERLVEAYRVLDATGSLFFHIDYREVHYCKVLLDEIFGRASFLNEIIWAYDYGARSRTRWSAKHDTILWYVKNPGEYQYHFGEIDRIPYMAPKLVGPEKAARGKTPTDVWWHTIVGTNSYEKTGYPTQKPLALLERIIRVHSSPGDLVLDFFAGSGTTGEAAARHSRRFIMVDVNDSAIEVMKKRLSKYSPVVLKPGINGALHRIT